jgi:aspartyl-tRNA synthetase
MTLFVLATIRYWNATYPASVDFHFLWLLVTRTWLALHSTIISLMTMARTHTCGELGLNHVGLTVTLCGWVQRVRDKGGLLWVDLRDRYGITQLIFEEGAAAPTLIQKARELKREYVVKVQGMVIRRNASNLHMVTGAIEVQVQTLRILNVAKTPPFLVEAETDGKEELRMQYRYLDLRRPPLQNNLMLRHQVMQQTRTYLNQRQFLEIETPVLIKSTPEGARDFVVPSRMHPGEFYALPQSPQTCKQLLMIAGFDRYYQFAKCFRDEDLRADRQPEFTQIDCELSFITQEDILAIFEELVKYLFRHIKNIELPQFPRMPYAKAMQLYGTDKPDLRFGMPFAELTHLGQKQGFRVFDEAALVVGICVQGCAGYTRKQLDQLTDFVKQPQVGASGLVYVKYNSDGSLKSSVDTFFDQAQLTTWVEALQAQPGDLILVLAGETQVTRGALAALRLKVADELGLRNKTQFAPLWVVDFPLLEWDAATQRYHARHHPFTAPQPADIPLLEKQPEAVHANAYDLVINGVEIGGGSIRICNRVVQEKLLRILGFSPEEAEQQFGFLLEALAYGTPPHGGIALGFDRLCSLLGGDESIRSFIAFPKNNAGRDLMLKAPAPIAQDQLQELGITL